MALSSQSKENSISKRVQNFPNEHVPESIRAAFLRTLIQSAEDAIITTDSSGKITSWNTSAERMYGYKADHVVGEDIGIIYPDEQKEEVDNLLAEVRAGKRKEPFRAARVRKDGMAIDVSVTVSPVVDTEHNYSGALFIQRDITEALEKENERRRLASIVNHAEDAIIGKRLDGTITSWNHGAEEIYGYTSKEAIGQNIAIIIPDDQLDELAHIMTQLQQGGRIPLHETVRQHKDGTKLNVSLRISPVRNTDDVIVGASAVARDITQRKRAERERDRALQQERAARRQAEKRQHQLDFIVRASEVLASSLDYETTLQNVAKLVVEEIADWCAVDLIIDGEIRRMAVEHLDPEKKQLAIELQKKYPPSFKDTSTFGRVFATGEPLLFKEINQEMLRDSVRAEEHLELIRELGLESAMVLPLTIRDNTIGALTLVSEDPDRNYSEDDLSLAQELAHHAALAVEESRHYTQMKSLNRELEDRVQTRTAELEQANKELESFSYSVSHDLRAPLRAIQGFGNILMDDYLDALPPEAQRYLNLIDKNVIKMGQLIDDLLTYSRVTRKNLDYREVDMNSLVREVLDELDLQESSKEIELTVTHLPKIEVDPALIRHVWQNLISNAFKYTKNEEVRNIHISCTRNNGTVEFAIQDNGVGFNMRYEDKLFEVFQRLHREEEYEGTGVGLAIVKQIVYSHGGEVWAQAEPNKGATFYFSIPERGQEDE